MGGLSSRGDLINWNQVYYFLEIATVGSIKRAAELLGLSPSTLSEHISQLEESLHVRLFLRQHRRLILTDRGRLLYRYAQQMFEAGKRFVDVVSPLPLGCYPVSIGMVPGPRHTTAYDIIALYTAAHPEVSMRLFHYHDHSELERALLGAKLDFGFTDHKSERKGMFQACLDVPSLQFFVSESLANREFKELMSTLPLLLSSQTYSAHLVAERLQEDFDISPCSTIVSAFPDLAAALCVRGVGVALLDSAFARSLGLVSLIPPGEGPSWNVDPLYVAWSVEAENSDAIFRLRPILEKLPGVKLEVDGK